MPLRRYLVAGVFVLGFVLLLYWLFADSLSTHREMSVIYLSGFLVLLLAGLGGYSRVPLSSWTRRLGQLLFWIAMGLLLIGGYSFRGELRGLGQRIIGELDPSRGQTYGASVRFAMADDGQFHIQARVGEVPVKFILDTGASDVMLSPADARRLGFDPEALAYTRVYETANGTVAGAPVVLPSVDIGAIHETDVAATVMRSASGTSLLGMSFLRRLSRYQVYGEQLTLEQ